MQLLDQSDARHPQEELLLPVTTACSALLAVLYRNDVWMPSFGMRFKGA
jgi:hypothetical protein